MSDNDKIVIFGQYLTEKCLQTQLELNATALNDKHPIDAIRRKAGQLEMVQVCLAALKELYQGDPAKFRKDYLADTEEEKKDDPESHES